MKQKKRKVVSLDEVHLLSVEQLAILAAYEPDTQRAGYLERHAVIRFGEDKWNRVLDRIISINEQAT